MTGKHFAIAIDGPSGAGKSTLARSLASHFGILYVDTGALYRTLGLFALRQGVDPRDTTQVEALLPNVSISLEHGVDGQRAILNGFDVSDEIRAHRVSQAASDISALPPVRAFLLELQRSFAKHQSVIMDGRDIGTVVLPDADLKIFLTADPEDRAKRRHLELLARGQDVSLEAVLADINKRDKNDETRAIAPLKPASGAVVLNTTGNTFEESFLLLANIVKEKITT